jgi:hypothetical protein
VIAHTLYPVAQLVIAHTLYPVAQLVIETTRSSALPTSSVGDGRSYEEVVHLPCCTLTEEPKHTHPRNIPDLAAAPALLP